MATQPLADLSAIDLEAVHAPIEEVRNLNPQREEFEQLSAIVHLSPENNLAVARRDIGTDEFWIRGHVPGNPVFPGVLMIEGSAQLAIYYYKHYFPQLADAFIVFRGVDDVRFRGQVRPGDTIYYVARGENLKPRMGKFRVQALLRGEVIYEGTILGAPTRG